MRNKLILAATLVAALGAGAAFAAEKEAPPEAAKGLEILKLHLKSPDHTRVRKVKVNAAGDVCGVVSGDKDIEFMVTAADEKVWANEGGQQVDSPFTWDSNVVRSTERAPYQLWKACQKG